jgi:hypothetical protein
MNKLMDYYRSIDLFGVSNSWLLFGREQYKSLIGSSLSLILIILLLVKSFFMILKIVNKDSYTISRTDSFAGTEKLNISNFHFSVCLFNLLDPDPFKAMELKDFYEVNTFIEKINITHTIRDTIPTNFCNELPKENRKYPYNLSLYDNCYCLMGNNGKEIYYDYKNYDSSSLNSVFNNTKKKMNDSFILNFYYTDYFFDYNSSEILNNYTDSDYSNPYGAKIYFMNKLSFNDADYNYFDLYEYKGEEKFTYQFSEKVISNQLKSEDQTFNLSFLFSKRKIFFQIKFMSIDDFLAIFGGFFQIFYMLLGIIGNLINKSLLNKVIMNKTIEIQSNLFKDKLFQEIRERGKSIVDHWLIPNDKQEKTLINFNPKNIIEKNLIIEEDNFSVKYLKEEDKKQTNKRQFFYLNLQSKERIKKISQHIFTNLLDLDNFKNLYAEVNLLKKLLFGDCSYIETFEKASKMCFFIDQIKFNKNIKDREYDNLPLYKKLELFLLEIN